MIAQAVLGELLNKVRLILVAPRLDEVRHAQHLIVRRLAVAFTPRGLAVGGARQARPRYHLANLSQVPDLRLIQDYLGHKKRNACAQQR